MSFQHQRLAAGAWSQLSLAEQLAHIGSEVERTISWKEKGNHEYGQKAFVRALELLSLTKTSLANETSDQQKSRLKEIARIYELLVDYFAGKNRFHSTDRLWRKYFNCFAYLTAKRRLSKFSPK